MADLGEMRVKIGADITDLERKLDASQKALAKTAVQANKLDSSLAKGKGANEAAFALTNLGRVAKDVPYGFIGIQNNLNPLLESFQRLKKETGSTGSALKALVLGLGGAGGVGLALSAVTAAVTFATIGFDMWTRGMKKSGSGLDAVAETAKKTADALKNIIGSSAQEAADVAGLVAILNSENETRERKISALNEIKKINPEIFEGLKLEGDAVVGVDNAYKAYLANLKTVISAKLLQAQLENKITELLKLQGIEQTTLVKNITSGLNKLLKESGAPLTLSKMQIEETKTSKATNKLTSDIEDLQAQLLVLSKGVEVPELKEPKVKEKTKKDIETISDVLAKMNAQLDVLSKKEILQNVSLSTEKVKVIDKTIDELLTKFKLLTTDKRIIQLEARISDLNLTEQFKKDLRFDKNKPFQFPLPVEPELKLPGGTFDDIRYNLQRQLKALGVTKTKIGVPIETANVTELNDTLKETLTLLQNMSNLTMDVLSPAFDALFTGILTGSRDAFKSFGEALNQTLVQLGAAILKAAAFAAILSAISPGVTFGSKFKSLLGFSNGGAVKGFATGGYIDGPGTRTSDSIFARLSKGEYVIKADTVSKFGLAFFDKLNKGLMPRFDSFGMAKFAQGGFVSPNIIRASQVPSFSGGSIGGGQLLEIKGNFELRNDRLVAAVSRGNAQIRRNG